MFQVVICSQQLEICKSCACLSSSPLLWRLINFRLFCTDDCRSWPRDDNIKYHRCWGKHAHIPDNDYWRICLFHVVWTIFLLVQLFLCGTHGIYFYLHPTLFSSIKQCAWAIISPKEFKPWVTRISFALLYGKQNYLLLNILWFAKKYCFWANF